VLEALKNEVLKANLDLVALGLVTLTWGNVSGISRKDGLVVIKPSGIPYETLTTADLVVVDLDGRVREGECRPSSDTLTHLELYKGFPAIGGVSHTHSIAAACFAQACREIPCFGTTHADQFEGPVPLTRFLTVEEIDAGYERNTGRVILERFSALDAKRVPGVLVAGHGPFTWGDNADDAVRHSLVLERIAQMAAGTLQLNPAIRELPMYLQEKHYQRKHGPSAYYGQKKT